MQSLAHDVATNRRAIIRNPPQPDLVHGRPRKKNGRSEGLRPIALEELPFAYAFFLDTADSLT